MLHGSVFLYIHWQNEKTRLISIESQPKKIVVVVVVVFGVVVFVIHVVVVVVPAVNPFKVWLKSGY